MSTTDLNKTVEQVLSKLQKDIPTNESPVFINNGSIGVININLSHAESAVKYSDAGQLSTKKGG